MARFLLEQYPDTVDSATSEEAGRGTPLHAAAKSGSVDCIELPLQHGANIEATTSDGATAYCRFQGTIVRNAASC